MVSRAYLGSDLPEDQVRINPTSPRGPGALPPSQGSGAMLGGVVPEVAGAELAGQQAPNPLLTSAGGGVEEAREIILERAQRYMGTDPTSVTSPQQLEGLMMELEAAYPDDGQLLDAIDLMRQQPSEAPAPAPDSTNIAAGPDMQFTPDRPY